VWEAPLSNQEVRQPIVHQHWSHEVIAKDADWHVSISLFRERAIITVTVDLAVGCRRQGGKRMQSNARRREVDGDFEVVVESVDSEECFLREVTAGGDRNQTVFEDQTATTRRESPRAA
jgi:hypothetical protein